MKMDGWNTSQVVSFPFGMRDEKQYYSQRLTSPPPSQRLTSAHLALLECGVTRGGFGHAGGLREWFLLEALFEEQEGLETPFNIGMYRLGLPPTH